jgi:HD-GYP domain-containing protein (c-di-GMP phosphodiesterase class II)
MPVKRQQSLHSFVYRGLAKRIAVATLVIAAVLTAAVILKERGVASEAVVETAHNRIQILLARTREIMGASGTTDPYEAFRESLGSFDEIHLKLRLGEFVFARFTRPDGTEFARSVSSDYGLIGEVEAHTASSSPPFPAAGAAWREVVRLDGRPHVHLVYPITNRQGGTAAHVQAVFAVSDKAVAEMRRDLLESIFWVIAIVLTTSAILYPVIITLTRRLAAFSEDLLESHLETVQILGSAIAKRDSDTSAHNFRVTMMAVQVAEVMGIGRAEMQKLIKGAYLHDVGKIGISDNILLKPARLDQAEFAIMKTHVDHGVDIVTRSEWLHHQVTELQSHVAEGVNLIAHSSWLDEAGEVVGGHHEKYDGSGYPHGLKGEEIPLVARIFAIADVFDALTCERPYKKPFSYEKSMAILEEGRGSHFDPKVLDAFTTLAESIYRDIAGREDERLKDDLEAITNRYFEAGLESLVY